MVVRLPPLRRDPSRQQNSTVASVSLHVPGRTAHTLECVCINDRVGIALSASPVRALTANTAFPYVACRLSRDHVLSALSGQPQSTAQACCASNPGC
jgi:hypothetical protein